MRTVSSKVSNREHAAIVKYANQAGESVSNLIRKVVISDAVYGDSGEIPAEYSLDRYPADTEEDAKDQVLEEQVKEIKITLGWDEKKPLLINKIAARLRQESKLIREEEPEEEESNSHHESEDSEKDQEEESD